MACTILGTAVCLGLENYGNVSGYIVDSARVSSFADTKVIKGEDGLTTSIIICDTGQRVQLEMIILDGTSADTVKAGDAMAVNGVTMRVEDWTIIYTKGEECKVSATFVKEDSMTYT